MAKRYWGVSGETTVDMVSASCVEDFMYVLFFNVGIRKQIRRSLDQELFQFVHQGLIHGHLLYLYVLTQ
jgi:hypothetical protein